MRQALCDEAFAQADITGTASYGPEGGATEVVVDALTSIAVITLEGPSGVLASVVVEPSTGEGANMVVFHQA